MCLEILESREITIKSYSLPISNDHLPDAKEKRTNVLVIICQTLSVSVLFFFFVLFVFASNMYFVLLNKMKQTQIFLSII